MPFSHAALAAPKPPPDGYPEDPQNVGEHLRKVRMDRGRYQREVGEAIEVDPATIRNWELGHSEPALGKWQRIIDFLEFVPFEVGDSLGERIGAWRKMNGVPRSELAPRLGVDPSTVWRWETGRSHPSEPQLQQRENLFPAVL